MDERNIINQDVEIVNDDNITKKIINGMIDEMGLMTVVKGCLIGICTGALSMAIYFEKCNKEMK